MAPASVRTVGKDKMNDSNPIVSKKPDEVLQGVHIFRDYLAVSEQETVVAALRDIAHKAPTYSTITGFGKPMSVKMTSAGSYGWFSDRKGYRYIDTHPSGAPWPNIPKEILQIWHALVPDSPDPECCLINFYGEKARMGLHQDRDEANFEWPVLSISLGDDALFRIGGTDRKDPTKSTWLKSGDVCLMGGDARLAFHGIDRTKFGTSTLLPKGGRLNLTLRVVN